MRRLNVVLFCQLLIILAVLGGGVYAIHLVQTRRISAGFLHQADRAEKSDDKAKAAMYMERYLEFYPTDTDALKRFAELRISKDPRGAAATLEKALVLALPDAKRTQFVVDVRHKLVDLYLRVGNSYAGMKKSMTVSAEYADKCGVNATEAFSNALEHLNFLDKDKKNGGLQLLRGKCQEELNHAPEAVEAYETARQLAPDQVEAYSLLAGLLRRSSFGARDTVKVFGRPIQNQADREKAANAVMDELVQKNGQSAPAYLARARYRNAWGLPGAADDAAQALRLAPEDPDALYMTVMLKGTGDVDETRQLLKHGIELHPTDSRLYEQLARVEATAGKLDAAVACLKAGIDRLQMQEPVNLTFMLTETLLMAGKTDEAAEAVEQLGKTSVNPPFNPVLREYLQARVDMAKRQWRRAAAALEHAAPLLAARGVTERIGVSAYSWLGRCYAMLNEPDLRLSAFRRAAEIRRPATGTGPKKMDSQDLDVQAGLASALEVAGKVDEAIEEYRKILTQPGINPALNLELARLLILRELRKPEGRRNWEAAQNVLDSAQQQMPGRPELTILRAEVLAAQKKFDEACKEVNAAREKQPDRPDLWVELATLEQRQGHAENAVSLLEQAEKRLGRLLALRIAWVGYWSTRGGPEVPARLSALEKSASDLTGEDRKAFLGALFEAYTRTVDAARTLDMGLKLARDDPSNLNLRLNLFDRALQDGNEAAADAIVREISKIETAGDAQAPLTGYCEAVLAMRKGKGYFDEARTRLRKVAQLRPDWSRVPLVEAQINEKEGKLDLALTNYLRAIDKGDRSLLVGLRAAELLSSHGRYAEAEQVFQRLAGQQSAADQQRVEIARRLTLARADLAAGKNDFKNHLKLGQMLNLAGQAARSYGQKDQAAALFKEAETELRQTITLAREPDAYVALVQVLAAAGRADDARKAVADAEQALPGAQNALRLARCYLWTGEPAKVKACCQKAVAGAPEDPQTLQAAATFALEAGATEDAVTYLDRLTQPGTKAPRDVADAARRVLALLKLTLAHGAGKIDEALAILGENHTTPQGQPGSTADDQSVADRRTKARILARYPIRERRREAIPILEKLVEDGAATVDDKTLLYGLYESDDNWPKARAFMTRLLTDDPTNTAYLAPYALSLIRHGQPAEAVPLIQQVEQLAASPRATVQLKVVLVELQARLLVAQGHQVEAVKQVLTFARSQPGTLLLSAQLLEQLGSPEPAEPLYREFVAGSKSPEAPFALAEFLARQRRLKDALDLCEGAWPKCHPDKAASLSIGVLSQASPADDASCRRVASWIDEVIRKNSTTSQKLLLVPGPALRLMSWGDGSGAPIPGNNLDTVIVGIDDTGLLHIRIFDAGGKLVTDTDERKLFSTQAEKISTLKQQLPAWLPPHVLTDAEKAQVITEVTSILGQTLQFPRAYLYVLQAKYDEAERIYQEIAGRVKDNGSVLNNLGWLLCFQKGRAPEALDVIRRAIVIEGELSDFVDTRALAHMALGQFDAAIHDLENAVTEGPPVPEKYFHLALAYLGADKKGNARQAFQKATELKLTREGLHPLERPGYDKLTRELSGH